MDEQHKDEERNVKGNFYPNINASWDKVIYNNPLKYNNQLNNNQLINKIIPIIPMQNNAILGLDGSSDEHNVNSLKQCFEYFAKDKKPQLWIPSPYSNPSKALGAKGDIFDDYAPLPLFDKKKLTMKVLQEALQNLRILGGIMELSDLMAYADTPEGTREGLANFEADRKAWSKAAYNREPRKKSGGL